MPCAWLNPHTLLCETGKAQLAAAEGNRKEAEAFLFNNPELSLQQTRRQNEATDSGDTAWSLGVAQTLRWAGSNPNGALRPLVLPRSMLKSTTPTARCAPTLRRDFCRAFRPTLRVLLEQRSANLFGESARAVAKRRAAGEDTRLDANVAMVEAERARNSLASASEALLCRAERIGNRGTAAAVRPAGSGEVISPSMRIRCPTPWRSCSASARAIPKQTRAIGSEDITPNWGLSRPAAIRT